MDVSATLPCFAVPAPPTLIAPRVDGRAAVRPCSRLPRRLPRRPVDNIVAALCVSRAGRAAAVAPARCGVVPGVASLVCAPRPSLLTVGFPRTLDTCPRPGVALALALAAVAAAAAWTAELEALKTSCSVPMSPSATSSMARLSGRRWRRRPCCPDSALGCCAPPVPPVPPAPPPPSLGAACKAWFMLRSCANSRRCSPSCFVKALISSFFCFSTCAIKPFFLAISASCFSTNWLNFLAALSRWLASCFSSSLL